MATENAINLSDPGVISYDGAGTFTGSVLTQHDVLVGGAANAITSVSPSTASFVLTSNGISVDPSFQVNPGVTAIKTINVQTFTTTGVYTPLAGMKYCLIEAVGGGGPGVGVTGIAAQVQTGSGGGGGAYVRSLFTAAQIGASQVITIGAGGIGNSGVGAAGGNTTVGSLLTAGGGPVGITQGAIVNTYYPSTPGSNVGSASGTGTIVIPGGTAAGQVTLAQFVSTSPAGTGGGSYFGAGGAGPAPGPPFNNPGIGYGSGGSGATNSGGGAVAGGAGAPGLVIITEYIA